MNILKENWVGDHYSTHLPLLTSCIAHTTGPILELGMGYYSTSVANLLAKGRFVRSMENNMDWLKPMEQLWKSPTHVFDLVPNETFLDEYIADRLAERRWSVVFVDHIYDHRRSADTLAFKDNAELVVVHDSYLGFPDKTSLGGVVPHYKYHYEYTDLTPSTAVFSNTNDLSFL